MPPRPAGADRHPTERPLILVTPDFAESEHEAEEFRLRANYVDAITDAGGTALILTPRAGRIEDVLGRACGLVVSGTAPGILVAAPRLDFERAAIAGALRRGLPVLGICHGMQMIGEALGGEILRDLPELLAPVSMHLPRPVPDRIAHDISLAPGSCLAEWQGGLRGEVNSFHRHVLGDAGRGRIIATAPDGRIEAIEGPGPGFCLGVQWHPEYRLTALDRAIWRAFVERCARPLAVAEGQ